MNAERPPSVVHGRARCRLRISCRNKLASKASQHAVPTTSPPPRPDYVRLLNSWRQGPGGAGCPPLLLAPMENLADRPLRMALAATVGGFDEACTEFIRIPGTCEAKHVTNMLRGVCVGYDPRELGSVPLGAQIMGSNAGLMAEAAAHLAARGAPRIDLNCGCPANTVTGHGAGSSLLRTPDQLHGIVAAMVAAAAPHGTPVSVKLRAGFADTSLFEDNLLAAQEAGAAFVTLHPRTKAQGYAGRADWGLIAAAKALLSIPVVGNGDVQGAGDAAALLEETGCDGVMLGRGAIQDPLVFHRIKAALQAGGGSEAPLGPACLPGSQGGSRRGGSESESAPPGASGGGGWEAQVVQRFLRRYAASGYGAGGTGAHALTEQGQFGRLKKVCRYLFSANPELQQACERLLRRQTSDMGSDAFVGEICGEVARHWQDGGPRERRLINHLPVAKRSRVPEAEPALAAAL